MRAIVTGACGFIGQHLVRALESAGHETVPVDLFAEDPIDITGCEFPDVGSADWLFHLAAVSRTPAAIEDPVTCFDVNVMGSVHVLETARMIGCKRVVMASSNVVYAAQTPYRASKLAMEEAAAAYRETYGLPVVCLRFSNVTGPGLPKGDAACVAALRDSLEDKGYVELTGDGEQSRDFSHVADICRAILMAAESDYLGKPIDVCTGRNLTMNQVVAAMEDALGHRIERRYVEERRGDVKHIRQDPEQAFCGFGYRAVRFAEEAVADAVRG